MPGDARWPLNAAILGETIAERAAHAVACGALEPIATSCETIPEAGIPFQVRQATNLVRKQKVTKQRPPDFDPFLPYEQDLYVGDAGDAHVVLFNKFAVIEDHLLIVTVEFEHQDRPLTAKDFAALARCWGSGDLAFYNCGTISGASQRHKHLQLIPGLGPEGRRAPIEDALDLEAGRVLPFDFVHRVAPLPEPADDPDATARAMKVVYDDLMGQTGADGTAYNLLATQQWMMVVPRAHEHSGRTSINALGFAGSLFVRDDHEAEEVRRRGPLAVLDDVTR